MLSIRTISTVSSVVDGAVSDFEGEGPAAPDRLSEGTDGAVSSCVSESFSMRGGV